MYRPLRIMTMLTCLAGAAYANAALPQTGTGETDGYKLVWQDLFDASALNPDRWMCEVNGDGGGNSELQYYTDRPENVRLGKDEEGNGCLILTARRENYNNRNFTSGRVISKGRVAFMHGKVEASIKFPVTANGLWPAFWMMGNDFDEVGWPACGETDFIEMGHQNGIRQGTSDRYYNGAMHWGARWDQVADHAKDKTHEYSLQDGQFHLITVFWDEDIVRMYCDLDKYPDQEPYFEMTCPVTEPDNPWNPGNYFHKENFLLFNLAVGGHFPGIYKPEGVTALNDNNEASMYINYVKIYQKGDASESITTPDGAGDPQPEETGISTVEDDAPFIRVCDNEITAAAGTMISVYDTMGACLASADGSLSIAGLAHGIYIIRAFSNTGKPATLTLTK